MPGDPFSPPDDHRTEVEQDDDIDDDNSPTTTMSSLEKSLQVTIVIDNSIHGNITNCLR